MRACLVLLLFGSTVLADARPGDLGTPEYAKATALVQELGHKRYTVREAAASKLVEMGASAVGALRDGQKSADEEVRTRSAAILPKAMALDWKRRADAFIADSAGKDKHELPLLAEYTKAVGPLDAGSRKLFADMIRSSGTLLEKADLDRAGIEKAVKERTRDMLGGVQVGGKQVKADPAELAAVLFAHALAKKTESDNWQSADAPAMLLGNPALESTAADKEIGPAFRKLFVHWAEARTKGDNFNGQYFCMACRKYSIPEAVPMLAKMAKDKTLDVLSVRIIAIDALAKAGGSAAEAALGDIVSDSTKVLEGFGGQEGGFMLGDSALAGLLTLSKKKHSDYGLGGEMNIGFQFGQGGEPIMLSLRGFNTQADREKAIKRWKDEKAKK